MLLVVEGGEVMELKSKLIVIYKVVGTSGITFAYFTNEELAKEFMGTNPRLHIEQRFGWERAKEVR